MEEKIRHLDDTTAIRLLVDHRSAPTPSETGSADPLMPDASIRP